MGQFDQTVDDEQGVSLTPDATLSPMSASDLGVSAALLGGALRPAPVVGPSLPPPTRPTVPTAPAAPGGLQHIISAALLGLAAGLGPRSGGGGIAQGLMQGQAANADRRQQEFHDAQVQYQQQQQEALRQQALDDHQRAVAAAAEENRQRMLQQALNSIRAEVKTLPDKAAYDTRIDAYAGLLQGSGFRLDGNALRKIVPFIAPTQKQKAQEAVAAFFKNPLNAQQVKDDPNAAMNAVIAFDANHDGVAERIPLATLMDMAGAGVLRGPDGQPLALTPSISAPAEQQALRAKIDKFTAENGRPPTRGAEMDALITAARTPVTSPKDPLTEALQQSLLDERRAKAKNAASGGLTDDATDYAATQYRVTGTMPALGMGSAQARTAVINRAAEQTKALHQTPAESIQKQAAFKADASALTQMRRMSSAAEAFETKALAQADIVGGLSAKVDRTQYPIINDGLLTFKARVRGDANTQLLYNALATFTTEYAKIMEGSTGSAAASSQDARRAAAELISAGLNKGTLAQTLDLMRKEMRLTIQGYGAASDHITERMGGPTSPAAAPTAAPVELIWNKSHTALVPKGSE